MTFSLRGVIILMGFIMYTEVDLNRIITKYIYLVVNNFISFSQLDYIWSKITRLSYTITK